MSSDDQHFLDIVRSHLSSLPNNIAGGVEHALDSAAIVVRKAVFTSGDALSQVVWVPQSLRTPPPPPPPSLPIPQLQTGLFGSAQRWILDNRALTAAIVAFCGTGGYLLHRQRKMYLRKRRAKRASNGARSEVVVVAGTLNSAITHAAIVDLERRGFIVYVVCNTPSEEQLVRKEGKIDIIPLHLNVTDPFDVQNTIEHFTSLLRNPQFAAAGATPHSLTFAGLILIPDSMFPAGPIETLQPDLWSDAMNAKILGTVTTAQAFLRPIADFHSRVLVCTPNIVPSLRPAFHAPEASIIAALDAFTTSLRAELATLGAKVIHIKMGAFDTAAHGDRQALARNWRSDILSWASAARSAYAKNYLSQQEDETRGAGFMARKRTGLQRGSPLREFNNAVFDALTQNRPWSVRHVGRGSLLYEMVGTVVPPGVVGWMMGLRRVNGAKADDVAESNMAWEKVR